MPGGVQTFHRSNPSKGNAAWRPRKDSLLWVGIANTFPNLGIAIRQTGEHQPLRAPPLNWAARSVEQASGPLFRDDR